jgi:hypothetical protein
MMDIPDMEALGRETCPRCKRPFFCSKSGKCWCYEVFLPVSLLEEIESAYDRCLCPSCLADLIKGHRHDGHRLTRQDFIMKRKREPGKNG